MSWFKPSKQDQEMIELLKKSGSDFEFDVTQVKYRLLTSINQSPQKSFPHFRIGRVAQYSVGFAGLVVIVSTTFAFASNAKPGDKLFELNKFGENVILTLPMSDQQKAKVQEYIVTSRLEALDQVKPQPETENLKFEARKLQTIKESEESFMTAVDNITANKKKLEASGKTQAAEKLGQVLDQLQIQAQKRESTIKDMEEKTTDSNTKTEIQNHLRKIEISRKKAQAEIKRYQDDN